MPVKSIFNINKLQCEYKLGVPALRIDQVEIPSGKLVFLIGRSGIGKSTFIETLGLMNRTIAAHPETSISFSPDGVESFELKDSWNLSNEKLSALRRNYFSFIFQNTNLMPNFTSGENMMVSLLIEGQPYDEAKEKVLKVMDRLSLSASIFDKKVTEISGGQRQRLAFVRAVTANFTVLFGDEPTGNLDRSTSEELMAILKELITLRRKTGIIVSHDLVLADKFADMIIPLNLERDESGIAFGGVNSSNIIYRKEEQWVKANGDHLPDAGAYLNQFLTTSGN